MLYWVYVAGSIIVLMVASAFAAQWFLKKE